MLPRPFHLAAWLLFAAAGCTHSVPPAVSAAATTRPTTQPGETAVVYSVYQGPKKLTPAQMDEIRRFIKVVPHAASTWFIYVHANDGSHYRVTIYYRPDDAAGPVRHGLDSLFAPAVPLEQYIDIWNRLGDGPPKPSAYVQVPRGPTATWPATPSEADVPFARPGDFSDDEIAAIVAVAREALLSGHERPNVNLMPVRTIENRNGEIQVRFGWQAGGLNGQGFTVTLVRVNRGFKATAVAAWVS